MVTGTHHWADGKWQFLLVFLQNRLEGNTPEAEADLSEGDSHTGLPDPANQALSI